jgi:hypothetical protein
VGASVAAVETTAMTAAAAASPSSVVTAKHLSTIG